MIQYIKTYFFVFLLFCSGFFFFSCGNESRSPKPDSMLNTSVRLSPNLNLNIGNVYKFQLIVSKDGRILDSINMDFTFGANNNFEYIFEYDEEGKATVSVSVWFTPDYPGAPTENVGNAEQTVNLTRNQTIDVSLEITLPQDHPPVAVLARYPTPVVVGRPLTLDGSLSYDIDGDALSFLWILTDFPSGFTSSFYYSTEQQFTFVPTVPGIYTVEFFVSQIKNYLKFDSMIIQLDVQEYGEPPYIIGDTGPGLDTNYEYRIVLAWGQNPRDLDAHLITPPINGVSYHTYYGNRNIGRIDVPPYNYLNRDVTGGFGPEIITIHQLKGGTYYYYVHHFSGTQNFYTSPAIIYIYKRGGELYKTIKASSGASDNIRFWNVFTINGLTGEINEVNTYSNTPHGRTQPEPSVPPSIVHNAVNNALQNTDIIISANVFSNVLISNVNLFYRITSEDNFSVIPMLLNSENNYSVEIPSCIVSTSYIQYYIEAIDISGNISYFGNSGLTSISPFQNPIIISIDNSEWIIYNFENSNAGLISNYTNFIFEEENGTIWVATNSGVSKFDGISWDTFSTNNSDLISNYVYSITKDSLNNMWFATSEGISRYDGVSWQTYTVSDGLSSNRVRVVYADNSSNQKIWAGTSNGISVYDGISWFSFESEIGLTEESIGNVYVVYEDKSGTMWFGTQGNGAFSYNNNNGDWTELNFSSINGNNIYAIFQDASDTIWFGTYGGGAVKLDYNTLDFQRVNFNHNYIFSINQDNSGDLWFAHCCVGVSKIEDYNINNIISYSVNDGLSDNNVKHILVSKFSDVIWFATYNGLTKLYLQGRSNILEIEMIRVNPLANPHGVTQSYYIGKYNVTNQEYAYVLNWAYSESKISNPLDYANPGTITDRISWNEDSLQFEVDAGYEKHPVTNVSYNDAGIWCNWLSEKQDLTPSFAGVSANPSGNFDTTVNGYRLPENGEWTYAAIGPNAENPDNPSGDWYYPWEAPNDNIEQRMNYSGSNDPWEGPWESGNPRTTPVGFFNGTIQQKSYWNWPGSASSFTTVSNASYTGAYDMAGNVWEWIGQVPHSTHRVLRGGSWYYTSHCGVSDRPSDVPASRFISYGFRLARTVSDNTSPDFSGLTSATEVSSREIELYWDEATDDITNSDNIVYLIYQSEISGSFDFSSPTYTTVAGATSFTVTVLQPSTTYYFVVRARDGAGNTDGNIREKSATTNPFEIYMIDVYPGENPHGVTEDYLIGKYPVTNEEYAYVLNWAYSEGKISTPLDYANPGTRTDRIIWNGSEFVVDAGYEKHPVTRVSYNDAGIWCNWLSEMEGLTPAFAGVSMGASGNFDTTVNGYRLPEDREWTYAAIGFNPENSDNSTGHWYYPWEIPNDNLEQRMNYRESNDPWEGSWDVSTPTGNIPYTTPVGFFNGTIQEKLFWNWHGSMSFFETFSNESFEGAYDMVGNVWEWTTRINSFNRVVRGGSWFNDADSCRVATRKSNSPTTRNHRTGFRVVLSLEN